MEDSKGPRRFNYAIICPSILSFCAKSSHITGYCMSPEQCKFKVYFTTKRKNIHIGFIMSLWGVLIKNKWILSLN